MPNMCDACGRPIDGAELVGIVIKGGRKDGDDWTLMLCDRCAPPTSQGEQTTLYDIVEQLANTVSTAIAEAHVDGRELTSDEVRGISSKAIGPA